jgi:hypothetical protein
VKVLLDAAFTSMITAGSVRALPVASRTRELTRPLGSGPWTRADALWGEIALLAGHPAGQGGGRTGCPVAGFRRAPWGGCRRARPVARMGPDQCLRLQRAAHRAAGRRRPGLHRGPGRRGPRQRPDARCHADDRSRLRADPDGPPGRAGWPPSGWAAPWSTWCRSWSPGPARACPTSSCTGADLDDSTRWCELALATATATARGDHNAMLLLFAWDVLGPGGCARERPTRAASATRGWRKPCT